MSQNKSIIIYYSRNGENYLSGDMVDLDVGNTERITNYILEVIDADVFKVERKEDYPFDYRETVEIAKVERSEDMRPELRNTLESIEDYDTIYIGTPNWCGTLPMVMYTQLEQLDFTDKTVKPFVTHEGSGSTKIVKDLEKLCHGANIEEALAIHGSSVDDARSQVIEWLEQ
ncbi:MAG: flavodoxin [Methanosphaera sp.]|nr:flavodoxin [Methanosphaera sp.]